MNIFLSFNPLQLLDIIGSCDFRERLERLYLMCELRKRGSPLLKYREYIQKQWTIRCFVYTSENTKYIRKHAD